MSRSEAIHGDFRGDSAAARPPAKRRWLRISLRALLVAFTCVAISVGLFARWAQQRRSALAAIRKAGGDIRLFVGEPSRLERWFGSDLFGPVNKIDLRKGRVDNALLAQIGVITELGRLDLSNAQIDDDGLRQIAHLPLRELWLQSTNITDASAATISQMKSLDFLQLNGTNVTDRFLEQLESLPRLDDLGLRGAEVTGAGMKFLVRHPKLQSLDVYSTAVDDAGVEALVNCSSLTDLGLSMTKVSANVFEILAKMPKLTDVDLTGNRPIATEAVLLFERLHPQCDVEWYSK